MSSLCIVTGEANGIGEGIVCRLHDDGYTVLICDVDKKKGDALSRELSYDNHAAPFIACDVKIVVDITRLINAARDLEIPVHALINNAGIFPRREFSEVSLEEWNEVVATKAWLITSVSLI